MSTLASVSLVVGLLAPRLIVPPLASDEASQELVVSFVESDRRALTGDEREEIRSIARSAGTEIAALLPGLPGRIELEVVSGTQVIPGFGSGAAAVAPQQIQWTVDPEFEGGPIAIARAELRGALFHESHHIARGWTISGGTAGSRMIDAAVAEGMATAFERDAAGTDPPWGAYLAGEVDGWVEELLAVETGLQAYQTWMFTHPDGRRWIGYRAGTYLTDRAMAECECSAADLVRIATDEVLALAAARYP